MPVFANTQEKIQEPPEATRNSITLYAFSMLLRAFLLFQVELVTGKSVLPWFGGGGVSVCHSGFQVLWLAGYGCALAPDAALGLGKQVLSHPVLLISSAFALAFVSAVAATDSPRGMAETALRGLAPFGKSRVCWLVETFGPSHAMLSAVTPLLQHCVKPILLRALISPGAEPLAARKERACAICGVSLAWNSGLCLKFRHCRICVALTFALGG